MENYIRLHCTRDQFGFSCSNVRKDGSVWEELCLLFCPHDDKSGLRHAGFAVERTSSLHRIWKEIEQVNSPSNFNAERRYLS